MSAPTVIMSINDNPLYAGFRDIVVPAWERGGFNVHLVDVGSETKYGVPYSNWSQVARILRYQDATEGQIIVSDIDLLPMDAAHIRWICDHAPPDTLTCSGWDAYEHDPWCENRKFPGCYMIARASVWADIVNPQGMDDADLVRSWVGLDSILCEEDPFRDDYSEESMLRYLVYSWVRRTGRRTHNIARGWDRTPQGLRAYNRLDRADWDMDVPALRCGYYIDAHLPRPMCDHMDKIQPLMDYLGVGL